MPPAPFAAGARARRTVVIELTGRTEMDVGTAQAREFPRLQTGCVAIIDLTNHAA